MISSKKQAMIAISKLILLGAVIGLITMIVTPYYALRAQVL